MYSSDLIMSVTVTVFILNLCANASPFLYFELECNINWDADEFYHLKLFLSVRSKNLMYPVNEGKPNFTA